MTHKYVCRQAGMQCDFELVHEDEANARVTAEQHSRQEHPEEISQQGRNPEYLLNGFRIIQ